MTRPSLLRSAALGLCALLLSTASGAQDYPAKPVRIIVPFAPGGSADVFGRFIAQKLQESLGQNFVVDNRPGAGSVIGTDAVAKSAPDGYTLLLMSNTHTVNESLIPNKPFQLMRDFVAIAPINYSDLVLVAKSSLPATSLQDVLMQAKAKADALSYASSGPGTPYHMAGELLKSMAGVSILHVPYKGSAGARTDVLGGQVDLMFDAIPTMSEHIRAGKVKALACEPPREAWRRCRAAWPPARKAPTTAQSAWHSPSARGSARRAAKPGACRPNAPTPAACPP